ncbi:MAG: hypothetical protein WBF90_37105 [Rivularia sp. (in: cyanobacteria)]
MKITETVCWRSQSYWLFSQNRVAPPTGVCRFAAHTSSFHTYNYFASMYLLFEKLKLLVNDRNFSGCFHKIALLPEIQGYRSEWHAC